MKDKQYYSAKEFAIIFDLSYRAILVAIKNGRIRAFKVGLGRRNPYQIPHSEILRIEVSGIIEINSSLGKDVDNKKA